MLYECLVVFVYRCEEGMREQSWTVLFTADDHEDAIHSAVRYAKQAERKMPILYPPPKYQDPTVGCVKLYPMNPGPISEDGHCTHGSAFSIFEWKYDWPGTLEESAEVSIAEERSSIYNLEKSRTRDEKELLEQMVDCGVDGCPWQEVVKALPVDDEDWALRHLCDEHLKLALAIATKRSKRRGESEEEHAKFVEEMLLRSVEKPDTKGKPIG